MDIFGRIHWWRSSHPSRHILTVLCCIFSLFCKCLCIFWGWSQRQFLEDTFGRHLWLDSILVCMRIFEVRRGIINWLHREDGRCLFFLHRLNWEDSVCTTHQWDDSQPCKRTSSMKDCTMNWLRRYFCILQGIISRQYLKDTSCRLLQWDNTLLCTSICQDWCCKSHWCCRWVGICSFAGRRQYLLGIGDRSRRSGSSHLSRYILWGSGCTLHWFCRVVGIFGLSSRKWCWLGIDGILLWSCSIHVCRRICSCRDRRIGWCCRWVCSCWGLCRIMCLKGIAGIDRLWCNILICKYSVGELSCRTRWLHILVCKFLGFGHRGYWLGRGCKFRLWDSIQVYKCIFLSKFSLCCRLRYTIVGWGRIWCLWDIWCNFLLRFWLFLLGRWFPRNILRGSKWFQWDIFQGTDCYRWSSCLCRNRRGWLRWQGRRWRDSWMSTKNLRGRIWYSCSFVIFGARRIDSVERWFLLQRQ